MAAMHPWPAAVMAWRYTLSCTSPATKTPGTGVPPLNIYRDGTGTYAILCRHVINGNNHSTHHETHRRRGTIARNGMNTSYKSTYCIQRGTHDRPSCWTVHETDMTHPIMDEPGVPLEEECHGLHLWLNTLNQRIHDNDQDAQPYCDTGDAARGQ